MKKINEMTIAREKIGKMLFVLDGENKKNKIC